MSRINQDRKQLQRRMNPVTLGRLIGKGVDTSQSRDLVNVFHVFIFDDVEPLSVELERGGYRVVSRGEEQNHRGSTYWLVECVAHILPVVSAIDQLTDEFVDIVARFDADYDGWYAKVETPP